MTFYPIISTISLSAFPSFWEWFSSMWSIWEWFSLFLTVKLFSQRGNFPAYTTCRLRLSRLPAGMYLSSLPSLASCTEILHFVQNDGPGRKAPQRVASFPAPMTPMQHRLPVISTGVEKSHSSMEEWDFSTPVEMTGRRCCIGVIGAGKDATRCGAFLPGPSFWTKWRISVHEASDGNDDKYMPAGRRERRSRHVV